MIRNLITAGLAVGFFGAFAFAQQPPVVVRPGQPVVQQGQPVVRQGQTVIQQGQPIAQPAGTVQQAAYPALDANDSLFIAAATAGNQAELNLSEVGKQRAQSDDLKDFSQRSIDDHTKLGRELQTIAAQKRVGVPATLDVCAQYCTQTLMRLSGDKFDQCYAKAQCLAHEGAIAAYEAEAENGQSEELREFARRNLPTLKKHLKTIKSVAHKYEKDDKSSDDHAASDRKSSRDEKVDKTSGRDR